jgi:uncharacterized protein (DUF1697 family)
MSSVCGIFLVSVQVCAMQVFVALLRAVNVGGTGRLPMGQLKAMCESAGFEAVKTYIASGNVVFRSAKPEPHVKAALEARLEAYAGKRVGVLVRTAAEVAAVLKENPFPHAALSRTVAIFLDGPPPADTLKGVTGRKDEEIRLGRREIYVHYAEGMAGSKLKIPAAQAGTARNINTVAKLAEISAHLLDG